MSRIEKIIFVLMLTVGVPLALIMHYMGIGAGALE